MRLRRTLPAIAALALLAGAASPAVAARSRYDDGLLGRQDPAATDPQLQFLATAYTQSTALMGVLAGGQAGAPQAKAAIGWLLRQQCPDGGWQLYRADVTRPCEPTDLSSFAGEDTNTTALAVQALAALHVTPARDPLTFLRGAQNDADGGFGYLRGAGTDPNSTALVVQAFLARGLDPSTVTTTSGRQPYDALLGYQLDCSAAPADRSAFYAFDPHSPDVYATAQALPAAAGLAFPLPTATISNTTPTRTCPARRPLGRSKAIRRAPAPDPGTAAGWGATWLASQVTAGGYVAGPGGPSYGLTAYATLGMAATRTNKAAVDRASAFLAGHLDAAAADPNGLDKVGTLGLLAMTAKASGRGDPTGLANRILADCSGDCGLAPTPTPTRTGGGSGSFDRESQPGVLPFTGLPVGLLLLAGGALVALGVGARRTGRR